MASFKVGDYILHKDKILYRIVDTNAVPTRMGDIHYYDVRSLNRIKGEYGNIRGLNHIQLIKLGKLIPEESATELLKVLYSEDFS